ncbi:ATP-dependent protease LonB [Candidatus Woesearchaeota archaeon]|nr:ATP-dependent protease LonB [Candidatus Woesearchaeota archaeon]
MALKFSTTADIKVPPALIDQVIGQDDAVEIIKKAAKQRRHVLLIGEPGTGKSLLGVALANLLPKEKLVDVLTQYNPNDDNQPLIKTVPAGQGRALAQQSRMPTLNVVRGPNMIIIIIAIVLSLLPYYFYSQKIFPFDTPVVFAASMITGIIVILGGIFILSIGRRMVPQAKTNAPKVIVDNYGRKTAPFWDATGAHAGALLGDVLHDPLQSGGLGTPAHERVVAGMIHKAHMGVLFIDEIATLHPATQQELLTALQEGRYAITGQSERSSGAMVRTEPVPCNFILVAAGNLETIKHMHPALRSRIRGYGYEIYMKETFKDTEENRMHVARFVAQEIAKDQKIPHFSKEAVKEIIEHARKMANRKGHLTLRFRELGGLVRAAGDVAKEHKAKLVSRQHVRQAKKIARSLEKQIADRFIERKKEYEVIVTSGKQVGRVNGLAVIGSGASFSGVILPIECEVTAGGKEKEIVATGKLGQIAKEAVKNVTAIVKRYFGQDIKDYDIYVQFLQTYEGVEGDSASIAVAISIISSLKNVPVRQDVAMTGSLSVRGKVLPVGGVSAKVEAAIEAGVKKVIIPKSNLQDIVINADQLKTIEIIPVSSLGEVLKHAMDWKGKQAIRKKISKA